MWKKDAEWIPADGFILEAAALEVATSNSNNLVVAGPGAGKTELLAQRACYLIETNTCTNSKKILAMSDAMNKAAPSIAEGEKLWKKEEIKKLLYSLD